MGVTYHFTLFTYISQRLPVRDRPGSKERKTSIRPYYDKQFLRPHIFKLKFLSD